MIDANEQVVLCDSRGQSIGLAGKLDAHRNGQLHLAVSVFLFDRQGRVLLQKRQAGKYHSPGQWANTCCSHPRADEPPLACAQRRLQEEMGISCALTGLFQLLYKAEAGNGLIEHEYVHCFAGNFEGDASPDPREVSDWRWVKLDELVEAARAHPQDYAPWLRIYLDRRREEIAAAAQRASM